MTLQSKLGMALASVALGLGTSACHESKHHGHNGGGSNVYTFAEAEPNNVEFEANYLGSIAIGETLIVRGYIDDSGYDPFDGFAFTTYEPMDVEIYLIADDPFADLDMCYFNPYTGLDEACWETSFNPEAGLLALNGGEDFHLVVASYFGGSSYSLEVTGLPIGYAPAAAAPGQPEERRERSAPFSDYGGQAEAQAALEEPAAPAARGRVIVVDPEDGSVLTQEFELGADGRRTSGPVTGSVAVAGR